jgi:hypothetical protein
VAKSAADFRADDPGQAAEQASSEVTAERQAISAAVSVMLGEPEAAARTEPERACDSNSSILNDWPGSLGR